MKVSEIFKIPIDVIETQLDVLIEDFEIGSIKTGMLVSKEVIDLITRKISSMNAPVIVDPILKAGTGRDLLEESAITSLKSKLVPLAEIILPNIFEAEKLSSITIESEANFREVAEKLIELGLDQVAEDLY